MLYGVYNKYTFMMSMSHRLRYLYEKSENHITTDTTIDKTNTNEKVFYHPSIIIAHSVLLVIECPCTDG